MKATFLLLCLVVTAFAFPLNLFSQSVSGYEGDGLSFFLGKSSIGAELKDLKAHYKCEMANELHYLSKDGIELVLSGQTLNEIHLYKSSAVYGTYIGKLPKKLRFGTTPEDVRHLLGKPSLSYNSGYCEYEYPGFVLSCWFDSGRLTQVILSAKQL